jgi:uncharacterized protein YciI
MARFAPTVPRVDSDVFLVLCYDGEDSAAIRERELDGHLEYVEQHTEQYLVAGPLRDPGTSPLIGSFFLVAADSADAARAIVADDPYVQSGMYAEIIVHTAVPAGGRFMGGVIWDSADALRGKAS